MSYECGFVGDNVFFVESLTIFVTSSWETIFPWTTGWITRQEGSPLIEFIVFKLRKDYVEISYCEDVTNDVLWKLYP